MARAHLSLRCNSRSALFRVAGDNAQAGVGDTLQPTGVLKLSEPTLRRLRPPTTSIMPLTLSARRAQISCRVSHTLAPTLTVN